LQGLNSRQFLLASLAGTQVTFQNMTLIVRKLSIGQEGYLLLSQFTIHL
jgi:hypothetical protein